MGDKMQGSEVDQQRDRLVAVTVRFTSGAMETIDRLAEMSHRSKADIVRLAVDDTMSKYLSNVIYVDRETAAAVSEELYDMNTTLSQIQSELRRIGINYNQELRLQHIERKYRGCTDAEDLEDRAEEEEKVKEFCSTFPKEDLLDILVRYENVTRKVSEILCRIAE